ncbi:MAG: hypothetical protein H6747_02190 [Deltaproteobacteria bacterium]|nr:hypothetical protein [Deltaproteobacteria bacterium]
MPTYPVRRCSAACAAHFVLLAGLITAGCSGGSAGATGDATPATRDGNWSGAELSFIVVGGKVAAIQVAAATCTGDDGCSATYPARTLSSVDGVVAFSAADEVARVEGQFHGAEQASGSLRLDDGAECCVVVTAWTASWQAPAAGVDGGSLDGGVVGGGGLGSVDWGGASLGSVHPGPSRVGAMPDRGQIAGVDDVQRAAVAILEEIRATVGVAPIRLDAAAAQAAQAHAVFYVDHAAAYAAAGLSPHAEDASFGAGFTGNNFAARMAAAGYGGTPSSEVMAFTGSASGAITGWMETLYHRLPLIDPGSVDVGYGAAAVGKARTEVMVFGAGKAANDPIVVWPFPGQTGVPKGWSGNESPQPPPPTSGYPSGPIVTARLPAGSTVQEHGIAAVGASGPAATSLPHVFLSTKNDPELAKFDARSVALYAEEPLAGGTVYEVWLEIAGASGSDTLRWRFETAP